MGGLLGAAFVTSLGMPGVFVVPAVLCGLAAVGMVALAVRLRRPSDPGADEVTGSAETAVGTRLEAMARTTEPWARVPELRREVAEEVE